MLDPGVLVTTLLTKIGGEAIPGMTLTKVGGQGGGMALIVKSGIREEYHTVDMKESTVWTMKENEVDMKAQGGHLVCFDFIIEVAVGFG